MITVTPLYHHRPHTLVHGPIFERCPCGEQPVWLHQLLGEYLPAELHGHCIGGNALQCSRTIDRPSLLIIIKILFDRFRNSFGNGAEYLSYSIQSSNWPYRSLDINTPAGAVTLKFNVLRGWFGKADVSGDVRWCGECNERK
jgi:hypothetical protein